MTKINILQIGENDLSQIYSIPEHVDYDYNDALEGLDKSYDLCFLDRNITLEEYKILYKLMQAYRVFVFDDFERDKYTLKLIQSKMAYDMKKESFQSFLNNDSSLFFSYSYGEKFRREHLCISRDFKGEVFWNGFQGVSLNGDYGADFYQIAYWKINIPILENQVLDFWLEYEKDDSVSIQLQFDLFQSGSVVGQLDTFTFSEKDLENPVYIQNEHPNSVIFATILAKGKGNLKIVDLHDRHSRKEYGTFLPGGIRRVNSKREEAFFYFDPMDMKPPLSVYFSGYKTQEGFEGYNMMRRMGAPFLLISDSRLEGGAFYLGNQEYEKMIVDQIQSCLDYLGFDSSQLILSGLSMGTFGSLYYGCFLKPHAILLGKPLASLGNMAENERISRPGGFPTSLDILSKNYGDLSPKAIQNLNQRFWNLFDSMDWSNTKFIISYMIEDDYDGDAYKRLIDHMDDIHVSIYGKGLHGRHNDNTYGIVEWFINQYHKVLKEDFNRNEGSVDA